MTSSQASKLAMQLQHNVKLDSSRLQYISMCATFDYFVLHDKSSKAAIVALRQKDEEDHGEESPSIIFARCLNNSEKNKKIVKQ